MARRIDVDEWRNFTGGLNLRADAFHLAPDESPDLLNVSLDPRGGFARRKTMQPFNSDNVHTTATPSALWAFDAGTGGVKQVLVSSGFLVRYSTGGAWTTVVSDNTVNTACRAVTFNNNNWIQNGTDKPIRWTGAAATRLNQSFSDNLDSPTTGNMPIARYIASHQGSVWVAYTRESATNFPNRVRWSHPSRAQSWRTNDYIDIDDGADGDEIQALVPLGEALYVIKRNSIYGIFGTFPDFNIVPITTKVGACNPDAVARHEGGFYFFSWPDGVFHFDGRNVEWQFERLYPAITDGLIPDSQASKISLTWGARRLWVNVPWGGSSVNTRTLVMDPTLSKEGSWTFYAWCHGRETPTTLGLGPMLEWTPAGSDAILLAGVNALVGGGGGASYVVKLEQDGTFDQVSSALDEYAVEGHYQTAWYVPRGTAYKKRFKRPEFVLRSDGGLYAALEVFKDFNESQPVREVTFTTELDTAALVWDSIDWDEATWAFEGDRPHQIKRFGSLGGGRSVSLKIRVPDVLRPAPYDQIPDWSVNSISFKYRTRHLRS